MNVCQVYSDYQRENRKVFLLQSSLIKWIASLFCGELYLSFVFDVYPRILCESANLPILSPLLAFSLPFVKPLFLIGHTVRSSVAYMQMENSFHSFHAHLYMDRFSKSTWQAVYRNRNLKREFTFLKWTQDGVFFFYDWSISDYYCQGYSMDMFL